MNLDLDLDLAKQTFEEHDVVGMPDGELEHALRPQRRSSSFTKEFMMDMAVDEIPVSQTLMKGDGRSGQNVAVITSPLRR